MSKSCLDISTSITRLWSRTSFWLKVGTSDNLYTETLFALADTLPALLVILSPVSVVQEKCPLTFLLVFAFDCNCHPSQNCRKKGHFLAIFCPVSALNFGAVSFPYRHLTPDKRAHKSKNALFRKANCIDPHRKSHNKYRHTSCNYVTQIV